MSVDDVEDPMLTDLRVLGYDPSEPTSIYWAVAARGQRAPGPRGDPARPLGVRQYHLAPAPDRATWSDAHVF